MKTNPRSCTWSGREKGRQMETVTISLTPEIQKAIKQYQAHCGDETTEEILKSLLILGLEKEKSR